MSSTRLHLPESADSSLVTLATIETDTARAVRLRLRLQWIVRILFGDTFAQDRGWNLKIAKVVELATQAGISGAIVATAFAAINVPLAYLGVSGGLAAPPLIDKLSDDSFKRWFRPLTGKKHLKSTIFRAFR